LTGSSSFSEEKEPKRLCESGSTKFLLYGWIFSTNSVGVSWTSAVIASAAKQSIFFAENLRKDGLLRRLRRLAMTTLDRSVLSRAGIRCLS
jgi:hypothetical protein